MVTKKEIHRKRKEIEISVILLIIVIIVWSMIVYYVGPEGIVDYIGMENAYLVLFVGGLLGGVSLLFPFPNYLLVFTFGAAGLNPFLIGAVAAAGIIIGESTSYFVGYSTHSILPISIGGHIHGIKKWLLRRRKWTMYSALFLWGSIFPLPNDFMLIPLGVLRYPFWRTMIPLGLGNLVFNTLIAFAGAYGWTMLF